MVWIVRIYPRLLPMAHKRISLSLSPEVYASLVDVSDVMGISRSALVNEVLSEALPALSQFFRIVHGATGADAPMRLRGASADVIRGRLDQLRTALDDMDPDAFQLTPCDDRPAGCSCDYSTGARVSPPGGCLVHGRAR